MCLIPISDKIEASTMMRLKNGIVEEPAHLNRSWLAEMKWIVVPKESACHFNEAYVSAIAKAYVQLGTSLIFATATEDAGEPGCYAVAPSKNGLLAFSFECAQFNYALIPADRSSVILCTVYDYFLVSGPMEFVKTAVGGDIKEAWDCFEEAASDPCWEGRLQKVANRYRDFSGVFP
jgi:hypothetical protein